MLKSNGARYFYQGFLNSMIGTAVFRGSFNGIYDSAKHQAKSVDQKALIAYFCAVTAGAICYPIDIIRRRRILINSTEKFLSFGSKIWRSEGVRGFYKGSKLIPLQSLAGAAILLIFDTAGLSCSKNQANWFIYICYFSQPFLSLDFIINSITTLNIIGVYLSQEELIGIISNCLCSSAGRAYDWIS